jgi:hypothetical protein
MVPWLDAQIYLRKQIAAGAANDQPMIAGGKGGPNGRHEKRRSVCGKLCIPLFNDAQSLTLNFCGLFEGRKCRAQIVFTSACAHGSPTVTIVASRRGASWREDNASQWIFQDIGRACFQVDKDRSRYTGATFTLSH